MPRALCLALALATLAACRAGADGPVTVEGVLEAGDETLTSGEFADRYSVRVGAGQWLRVTLHSTAFDPYLIVNPPQGRQIDKDDSAEGDTTMVALVAQAQEAGPFEILTTTYRLGAEGPYTLTYEVTDAEPVVPVGTASAGTPGEPPAGAPAASTAPLPDS